MTGPERRRLVKLGKPLGTAIRELITIVSPRTFLRWANGQGQVRRKDTPTRKPGRPRTADDVRALVVRLARENGWGYTRILGELKKLGVRKICRSTVINILREEGLDPGPKRGAGTWDEFLRRHAQTLWATDFFTAKVWTMRGLIDVFVLVFLHVGSRRVVLGGLTPNPDGRWMAQQARNFSMEIDAEPGRRLFLLRDRDGKFTREFDAILAADGVEVKRVGPQAPNMNAAVERYVQTVRRECLDHFVVFGEAHLRHLLSEFNAHYHRERPHQGLGNRVLTAEEPAEVSDLRADEVVCRERLGGLLKSYSRKAA